MKPLPLEGRLAGDPTDWSEIVFADVVATNRFSCVVCDTAFSPVAADALIETLDIPKRFQVARRYRQGWNLDVIACDPERGAIAICSTEYEAPLYIRVAARDAHSAAALLAMIHSHLESEQDDAPAPAEPERLVTYWWRAGSGVVARRRPLRAAPWSQARDNYPKAPRASLDRLMSELPPIAAGRIVILKGNPGTGKTNFARLLAHEYARRADVHIVLDSDSIIESTTVTLEVLLGEGAPPRGEDEPNKLRLVIIDEAERLLSAQWPSTTRRLREASDGLLDTGQECLFVLTVPSTTQIDSAILRPGRTAEVVDFEPFPPSEAVEWLETNAPEHVGHRPKSPLTLAELYEGSRRGADWRPTRSIEAGSYL